MKAWIQWYLVKVPFQTIYADSHTPVLASVTFTESWNLQPGLPQMQICPMIIRKWMIRMIRIWLNPPHLILQILFLRWINTFLAERNFVLLIVVDGCHFLDDAEEDRDCVFGEFGARVSDCVLVDEGRGPLSWGRGTHFRSPS